MIHFSGRRASRWTLPGRTNDTPLHRLYNPPGLGSLLQRSGTGSPHLWLARLQVYWGMNRALYVPCPLVLAEWPCRRIQAERDALLVRIGARDPDLHLRTGSQRLKCLLGSARSAVVPLSQVSRLSPLLSAACRSLDRRTRCPASHCLAHPPSSWYPVDSSWIVARHFPFAVQLEQCSPSGFERDHNGLPTLISTSAPIRTHRSPGGDRCPLTSVSG